MTDKQIAIGCLAVAVFLLSFSVTWLVMGVV